MLLKVGSRGEEVKKIQKFLGLHPDGIFGKKTEAAVKKWQSDNSIFSDGIVGPVTWDAMGILTTDCSESIIKVSEKISIGKGLEIEQYFLNENEYFTGSNPKYIFLHHTAGWDNPYKQIDQWNHDSRGCISTEFVIGGQSIKGNNTKYDGKILQSFPAGCWGWHLGTGRNSMHINSVGIEVCNFGWIKDGKTYVGTTADSHQLVTLSKPFRGFSIWHRYSDEQIKAIRNLIIYIGNRNNINIREGLPTWIRERGADAFEYSPNAVLGRVKGLLSHSNVRNDKFDMFPQPELMDMLVSL